MPNRALLVISTTHKKMANLKYKYGFDRVKNTATLK